MSLPLMHLYFVSVAECYYSPEVKYTRGIMKWNEDKGISFEMRYRIALSKKREKEAAVATLTFTAALFAVVLSAFYLVSLVETSLAEFSSEVAFLSIMYSQFAMIGTMYYISIARSGDRVAFS